MAKVKKQDWARDLAERFIADGRPIDRFFKTEEDERDEKRLAALLRRTFEKGYRTGVNMGDSIAR